jgi:hypothetical protein
LEPGDEALSSSTFGGRLSGGARIGGGASGLYDLELAHQEDAADNPTDVDVWYCRLDLGVAAGGWTVRAAHEVLEGGPGQGRFLTPLATLHAWNGWPV